MEKIKLTNLTVKTNKEKVEPILVTTFKPIDCHGITLDVEYLQAGELSKYVRYDEGTGGGFDFRKLFADKVKLIHNMTIEVTKQNADGTTEPMDITIRDSEEFLKFPNIDIFAKIINQTGGFLISNGKLSNEEVVDLR